MFYVKKMRGEIRLERLKELCKERIQLLHLVNNTKSPDDLHNSMADFLGRTEFLLDPDKDLVTHDVLLILATLSRSMRGLFVEGEKQLFRYRLEHDWEHEDISRSFRQLRGFLRDIVQKSGNVREKRDPSQNATKIANNSRCKSENCFSCKRTCTIPCNSADNPKNSMNNPACDPKSPIFQQNPYLQNKNEFRNELEKTIANRNNDVSHQKYLSMLKVVEELIDRKIITHFLEKHILRKRKSPKINQCSNNDNLNCSRKLNEVDSNELHIDGESYNNSTINKTISMSLRNQKVRTCQVSEVSNEKLCERKTPFSEVDNALTRRQDVREKLCERHTPRRTSFSDVNNAPTRRQSPTTTCEKTNCQQFSIKVPFQWTPGLVAKRQVTLDNGLAIFKCHNMEQLLVAMFNQLLQLRMESYSMSSSSYMMNVFTGEIEDIRTLNLIRSLTEYQSRLTRRSAASSGSGQHVALLSSQVKKVSLSFPACMYNIFRILEKGEKVKHEQRYQFSLFLKDLGMQVEEAQVFWHKYYSKIRGDKSKSLWEERRSRYVYSLLHMYGMKGSRRTYSGTSCTNLQKQGLCPFDIEDIHFNISKKKRKQIDQDEDTDKLQVTCHKQACGIHESLHNEMFEKPAEVFQLKASKKD